MKNKCTYILVGLMLFLTGCEDFLDKREDAGGLDETAIYASYESIRGFLDKVYSKLDTYNCMVSWNFIYILNNTVHYTQSRISPANRS